MARRDVMQRVSDIVAIFHDFCKTLVDILEFYYHQEIIGLEELYDSPGEKSVERL